MITDKILEKHKDDEDQLNFIRSTDKKIVVTAPAGCGKTTAMVSKIAWELENGNIGSNKKILALTFSVNAAIKIKESLNELLPEIVDDPNEVLKKVQVANYHRFAFHLLNKYGYSIDQKLTELEIFTITDDCSLSKYLNETDQRIMKYFDNAIKQRNTKNIKELRDKYWKILHEQLFPQNVITYNGILLTGLKLFRNPNIIEFYQSYYDLILVDEFQDTNLLQYSFIQPLVNNSKVIFLGDDTQKIYGFIGAIDNMMKSIKKHFDATEFIFKTNYRFKDNLQLKQLDSFIRSYVNGVSDSDARANVFLSKLANEADETNFIIEGLKTIRAKTNNNVAVLVRAGWQGKKIASGLDVNGITYFNALFKETDHEFIRFYDVAKDEFYKITSKNALQNELTACLDAIKKRKNEIVDKPSNEYIFDSLFHLLEKLFSVSRDWNQSVKEKYLSIGFYLENNGLEHMMEYIDEQIVITTMHSAKGLEWDYAIIPQLIAGIFPIYKYVCKACKASYNNLETNNLCKFRFSKNDVIIKDDLNLFYVAITRARKEVFLTTHGGVNQWNYVNKRSCLINLDGLNPLPFQWDEVIKTNVK